MKRTMLALLSLLLVVSVSGQESGIGVGLSSSGLVGKYWMGENALAIQLGSSIGVDYLFHNYDKLNITDNPTPVYYGAGLGIGSGTGEDGESELNLDIRGVVGVAYYLSSMPIDIYYEMTAGINVLGSDGNGLDIFRLGIRYFF